MNKTGLFTIAVTLVALGACTSTNNRVTSMVDTSIPHGKWHLVSYRIDCESTQFDTPSNHKLSLNETDNSFSLSTDCNMINGEFGITGDTIRFKNMFVTEMACENMIVEQDMLRLLNDSTSYAVCHSDTLLFTAPYIGEAIFIRQND